MTIWFRNFGCMLLVMATVALIVSVIALVLVAIIADAIT